jgi:hypothetical protein
MSRRVFRIVVDVEVDTAAHDHPSEWDWSLVLDAPASLVDVDEVAAVPRR